MISMQTVTRTAAGFLGPLTLAGAFDAFLVSILSAQDIAERLALGDGMDPDLVDDIRAELAEQYDLYKTHIAPVAARMNPRGLDYIWERQAAA
jgi:hypothetical protein